MDERLVFANRRGGARHLNAEDGSVWHAAVNRDAAVVDLDRPFGDGQPEPGAAALPRATFVDAEEPIENAIAVFARHAGPFVADLEYGMIAIGGDLDQDARSVRAVFNRVVDDIRDGFAE